jgi:hypothetical protein
MKRPGPITSPEEWEIELGVWRIRCRQAKAKGEPKPAKPHRIKPGPKGATIPDGLCVGEVRP